MPVKVKGINPIRNPKSGKVYYYCRQTKTRLPPPDDPEFLDKVVSARSKAKTSVAASGTAAQDRSFLALVKRYRESDGYLERSVLTKKEYDRHLAMLVSLIGSFQVQAFKREHGRKILNADKEHPSVGKARTRMLSVLMTFAVDELGWINANPILGLDNKSRRKKREDERGDRIDSGNRPLEEHEIRAVREANPYGTRGRALFEALLSTGFRRSDSRRIPACVDTAPDVVLFTNKSGSMVVAPVTRELKKAATAWNVSRAEKGLKPSRYLICSESGTPLHRRTVSAEIAAVFAAAGLEHLGAHALRYTAAVRLYEAKVDYDDIAEHLGHAAAQMARHYCRKKRNAAARREILDAYDEATKVED